METTGTLTCNRMLNRKSCNCTYEPCPRKGRCCECVAYHRERSELPACYFSREKEATFDRSFTAFTKMLFPWGPAARGSKPEASRSHQ